MNIRDSRFELIRILSMIFIVSYHFTMYGNWTKSSVNTVKIQFFVFGDKLELLFL